MADHDASSEEVLKRTRARKPLSLFAYSLLFAAMFLVPALYVGSYLAIVVPGGTLRPPDEPGGLYTLRHYRFGGSAAESIFRPLEAADRQIRPKKWAMRQTYFTQ
jgi:hypothetical protein